MAAISFFPPGQLFSLQTSEFILRLFINSSLPLSPYFHHQRHPLQSSLFINSGIDLLSFPSINSLLFRLQSSVFGSPVSSSVFTIDTKQKMTALKCACVGLLVLLCSSCSFAHRFFLDNDDQMHEGQRHGSTDDPGTGTGIGKDFGFGSGDGSSGVGVGSGSGSSGHGNGLGSESLGYWLGYGVGYGSGRNGYEDPETGESGWGIAVGSDGSVSGTGGGAFIPGLPGFGLGGSIRWPGFDFGGSIGLPGFEIGGGIGAAQGSGGAAGTRSPSYGIEIGQGGSNGGTIAGIGMPPPHFIPGYDQIGNGCTCSPECYNQVSTMKGGSVSKANDEHNFGAQNEVSRDEAHESIDVALEPWSPNETQEYPTLQPRSHTVHEQGATKNMIKHSAEPIS